MLCVELGFYIKKEMLDANLKEQSLVSQRSIYEEVSKKVVF